MPTTDRPPVSLTRQVIDEGLVRHGTSLADLVEARRKSLPRWSWFQISAEVLELTGRSVTPQSLINWFPEYRSPS